MKKFKNSRLSTDSRKLQTLALKIFQELTEKTSKQTKNKNVRLIVTADSFR